MRDFRDIYEDGSFAMGGACPARQPHELHSLADELRRNDFSREYWRDFEYLEDQFAEAMERYGCWTMERFPGLRLSVVEERRRLYARKLIAIAILIHPDELRRIEQHIVYVADQVRGDGTTPICRHEVKRMVLAEKIRVNERRWQQ